ETDLKNAEFFKAKMQSAHLEKADISGAKFEQADINDAFFAGIITTPETLKSLTKAFNWQKAHFDEEIRAQLEKLVTKV
ncbi:MAG TPA: pentapeptide repeat-containing protein, partial [Herpetosiphonaceae bacterium]